ncbi:hypothetical protein FIM12_00240 [SAR202 cluster bacterium AD-804-J14_MRT_500m]|nr:hypothetical protein [SAR202 cluster bacterium AD-804-J14_MRT_500m]
MGITPRQLGHLVIKVRDVQRSEKFYVEYLGLHVTGRADTGMVFMSANDKSSHELALQPVSGEAPDLSTEGVGLAHMAWQMDSFDDLRDVYNKLKTRPGLIKRVSSRDISCGIFLEDPDGHPIEMYYEIPKDQWTENISLISGGRFPLDLELDKAPIR